MKYRYLIGAGVALATMLSWADARAQMLAAPAGPGVWYFGGEGGWTSLENQKTTVSGVSGSATQSWNDGFNFGVRGGLEWGPWRFEEELRFQQNGTTSISNSSGSAALRGNQNAYAVMTNAIYDFGIGGWPITPHLGGGIGVVGLRDGAKLASGGGELFHGTDWEFGYQAIAGIRYNLSPTLAFDLDYRYLGTVDATYRTAPSGIATVGALGNQTVKSGYDSHNFVASLTWRFGAPPPVAAPPMAPAPPPMARRVFLVFFDWDRDTITPDGMAIVQQAADAFRSGAPVTIQVTGYTDRSGSPGYNQRLSQRRANNVAKALARLGVPPAQMAVSGRGENDNRVPTADGVREPQNRRVEIVFP